MDYSTNRRLESELREVARQHGYNGTPFLRQIPPLASHEAEMAAIWLSLAVIPRPETQPERDKLRRWARNIVLSSTEPEPPTPQEKQRRRVTW